MCMILECVVLGISFEVKLTGSFYIRILCRLLFLQGLNSQAFPDMYRKDLLPVLGTRP